MKYKLFLLMLTVFLNCFAGKSFSQNTDDDSDGVPNSEDICPGVKGTLKNKGCPEIENKSLDAIFITQKNFDDIMETICENAVAGRKAKNNISTNKILTTFPHNGVNKDLPVTYYVLGDKKSFITHIPLSKNVNEYERILGYLNQLFAKTEACWKTYRTILLERPASGQDASGIYSNKDNSVFVSLVKEKISAAETRVQLNILKTIYATEKNEITSGNKTVIAPKPPVTPALKSIAGLVLKPGNKLVYNWSDGNQSLKFTIVLKSVGSTVSYDYEITPGDTYTSFNNGLSSLKGTTTLSGTALTNPDDYYLIMQNNTHYKFDENIGSALWMSKKLHKDLLAAKKKTTFAVNGEDKCDYIFSVKDKQYPVSLNGKTLLAPRIEAFAKKEGMVYHTLNILDNPAFPLLLQLETTQFNLTLYDIITK